MLLFNGNFCNHWLLIVFLRTTLRDSFFPIFIFSVHIFWRISLLSIRFFISSLMWTRPSIFHNISYRLIGIFLLNWICWFWVLKFRRSVEELTSSVSWLLFSCLKIFKFALGLLNFLNLYLSLITDCFLVIINFLDDWISLAKLVWIVTCRFGHGRLRDQDISEKVINLKAYFFFYGIYFIFTEVGLIIEDFLCSDLKAVRGLMLSDDRVNLLDTLLLSFAFYKLRKYNLTGDFFSEIGEESSMSSSCLVKFIIV
jgi:hypothetical protein